MYKVNWIFKSDSNTIVDKMGRITILLLVLTSQYVTINTSSNKTQFTSSRIDLNLILYRTAYLLSRKVQEAFGHELKSIAPEMDINVKLSLSNLNNEDLLRTMTEKLDSKLTTAINLLKDMSMFIFNNTKIPSFTHPCPLSLMNKASYVKSASKYYKFKMEKDGLDSDNKFSYKWSGHYKDLKVKRQYFLSSFDQATDKDCNLMPPSHLRKIYHKINHSNKKSLVLLLDNTVDLMSFQTSIFLIKEIFDVLEESDTFGLMTLHDGEFYMFKDCNDAPAIFGNVSESNINVFFETITQVHMPGRHIDIPSIMWKFKSAIAADPAMFQLCILFSNESNYYQYDMDRTGGIRYELKTGNYSSLIMSVFNNASFGEVISPNNSIISLDPEVSVGQIASILYENIPTTQHGDKILTIDPYWDSVQRDFVVSLLLQCGKRGILGIDLYLTDLAEDIVYFKKTHLLQRAFMINKDKKILMHSYFPRLEEWPEKVKFTEIKYAEKIVNPFNIEEAIMSNVVGNVTVSSNMKTFSYTWAWVKDLFAVCIVIERDNSTSMKYFNPNLHNAPPIPRDLLYHRLDIFPPSSGNLCRHFKQVATIDKGTLYLSPSSFHSPFSYLHDIKEGKDMAYSMMQTFLAYLKDTTRLLSNPGLKSEVRNDVRLLQSLLNHFKKQHFHSPFRKYIVRRYGATESGVMVMYPGTILEFDYEPTRRPWYKTAVENPGKVILTPPNLDMGGAGYVISISYALPDHTEYPYMVLSMDISMSFLYKILIDTFPQCQAESVRCFIMDHKGYLISHPGLMDPNGSGPIEQQHITHKESLIASDMLNHKGFVTKRTCNNFSDRTIQRFYEFNTSLPYVLSNNVHGEHCVHYYVTTIAGTNAFMGLVNATCDAGAFCPCSMIDRLCLNCNRMEQNECECPCECTYNMDTCSTNYSNSTYDIPLCGVTPEKNQHKSHYFYNYAETLKPCFDFQCDSYQSYSSCLGILGCEWCQIDSDGATPLSSPFCTNQPNCFNGILGAITPYGEGTYGQMASEDMGTNSIVGPIAGCIVTICLIMAVAVYCYKQNSTTGSCRELYTDEHVEAWEEQDLQLSHLQSDENGHTDNSGKDKLLPTLKAQPPISPYKVVTGYKRPNPTGDSDHGYSTMTPHEDSEHMAFSTIEPIVSIDDISVSDDLQFHKSKVSSSKASAATKLGVTVLPCGKNSVIVPVMVHRDMEAS